jgi:RNA polymerase sigma-70 factor (ECF subfamily)
MPGTASEPATPTDRLESQGKADSRSLLTNGGVEDGVGDSPKAWTAGAMIPGVQYIWSRTGHTGHASLCLKKSVNRYFPIAQWSQKVDHQGDSPRLKVSAWVKADQVAKAILDAQFLDGTGRWQHAWVAYIGAKETDQPPVTHGWRRYEGVVSIPPNTKQIIIAPQIYGPGTVWFDDLGAEYTHDPTTDPIRS